MTPLSRLRELSARSTQIKELGLLTKNTPAYDKDGTFTGVENHYNGPGIAEAAGGAALVGAGLGAGHVGIMKKYGTETVRREKGRFIKPKEVKRSVAGAYKAAGADALGALKRVVGKRFSAKFFSGDSNLFVNLPEDWMRSGKMIYSHPEDSRGKLVKFKKPVRVPSGEVFESKYFPNSNSTSEEPLDYSPSRIRRAKAATAIIGAAGAGYVAGKHGTAIAGKIGHLVSKRFSAKDRLRELAAGPVAHAVFGTANVGAYNAPWGKKTEAYKDGYLHDSKYMLGGAALGGAAGAGIGALVGKKWGRGPSALLGGAGGMAIGQPIGFIKAIRDPRAKEIRDRHLSAKEFARGDRAIPAMKAILKASKEAPLHLNGVEGAAVPALRGNVHQVRRALNRFWGESASAKEAALHMKGVRSWAAGEIRGERTLPKDLRAWAPAPSYKVKGTTLSAKDRLKEFGKLPRLTLAIQRQGILTRGEAVSVPQSYRYGIDYGPEAVNHYGGNKKLIEDAIKNRAKIRSEIKSRVSMLSAKDRLRELAASSTFLKSFDEKLDENGHPIRDAAVGAGLGAGAVLGHQAVMKKYGQDGAGIGQAYGAAANDFKGGFTSSFNPPSTSAGSGSVATAATNSPLSADAAKLGGVAKAGEEASVLSRAGSKVGALGAAIRGFLSRMR